MVSKGQRIGVQDIFMGNMISTRYAPFPGKVGAYNGYDLPELLRTPLVQSESGKIGGYRSGGRSSLLQIGNKWFKKKGDAPIAGETWSSGQPHGGMSYEKALNELLVAELMDAKLRKFGYHGALQPAGVVKYDIPWKDSNVSSAILETYGEGRGSNLNARLMRANREGLLMDRDFREDLAKQFVSWIGFTHRIMMETSAFPEQISCNLSNYAIYRLNDGFGVSRIDFASAKTVPDYDPKKMFKEVFGESMAMNIAFCIPDKAFAASGTNLRDFAMTLERKGQVDGDWGQDLSEGMSRYAKIHNDALEGRTIPKPIERGMIYEVFDTIRF